jgi:hypothetical protein
MLAERVIGAAQLCVIVRGPALRPLPPKTCGAVLRSQAAQKWGEKFMPVGMFRSEEGWVQVDYGTGNIPIPRSKYEENGYKPDFDKLPSEAEYFATEKKKEDDAPRP